MIKEFSNEKDCIEWLRSYPKPALTWLSETKKGTFVGVVFDLPVRGEVP